MDRILALLDGSAYSESVCHHAAWIAKRLGASVEAMHVIGRREGAASNDLSGALRLGARTTLLNELSALDAARAKISHATGHAILEDASAIMTRDGVAEVTTRLRRGDLLEEVRAAPPGLSAIVIGKRGEGANFADGHLGSNLERIVRATHIPVFVASRAFRPIARVLLAFDASASAKIAADRITNSPVFAGMEICVLRVGRDDADTRDTTEQAASGLRKAGLNATARVVPGHPDEVLGRLVAEDGFDLLVMGAYGHSRIRSLVIGSTTTQMIRTVKIPVLLYR